MNQDSIQISPAVQYLDVTEGKQITSSITISNNSPESIQFMINNGTVGLSVDGIEQINNEPSIFFASDEVQIIVETGETIDFPFELDIPLNSRGTNSYPALLITPMKENFDSGVGIQERYAVYIFLNFEPVENLTVDSLGIEKFDLSPVQFLTETSIDTSIKNTSTRFLKPVGSLSIKDSSGKELFQKSIVNDTLKTIPPDGELESMFTQPLQESFFPSVGFYTAELDIRLDPLSDVTVSQSKNFFFFPIQYVVLLVVVLLVGVSFFVKRFVGR